MTPNLGLLLEDLVRTEAALVLLLPGLVSLQLYQLGLVVPDHGVGTGDGGA